MEVVYVENIVVSVRRALLVFEYRGNRRPRSMESGEWRGTQAGAQSALTPLIAHIFAVNVSTSFRNLYSERQPESDPRLIGGSSSRAILS
jgi:hypothetical protein